MSNTNGQNTWNGILALDTNEQDILSRHFPAKTPRNGQLEVIAKIAKAFNSGKKYVILEAPTGAGKSIIAKTIINMFTALNKKACYITSQIMLQNQLVTEFGENGNYNVGPPMIHLKGRSNYDCVYHEISNTITPKQRAELKSKKLSCAIGPCKQNNKSMCAECKVNPKDIIKTLSIENPDFDPNEYEAAMIERAINLDGENLDPRQLAANLCPYWKRVGQFLCAEVGLMNFKSFLFQCAYSAYFEKFTTDIMVIDECHNLEKELLDFVGLSFTDKLLTEALNIKMPVFKTVKEYSIWFTKNNIAKRLFDETVIARSQERTKDAQDYDNLAEKINYFTESSMDRWVLKQDLTSRIKKIEIKPIYVRNEAQNWLYNRADKVLMMSATVLSSKIMCDSLGIPEDQVEFIKLPNYFPVENREIHFIPAGSMSWKNKDKTLPIMVEQIEDLTSIHDDEKGIIHTHNFQIAEYIINNASEDLKSRLLFQKHFESKEEMLEAHSLAKNSILIAPAMHEGLDLKDELSRFQILCKIPYPNFKEDPQLEARMKISQAYYDWIVCLKIVQSYGRSIRSDTDYAITYILDSDFDKLYRNASDLLPDWFKEAIVK